jgi:hypothetical protein
MLGLLINSWPETRVIVDPEHRAAASVFSAINAGALILAILAGRDRGRHRSAERYRTRASVLCEGDDGSWCLASLHDVSSTGAGVFWPRDQAIPRSLSLHLAGGGTLRASVVRTHGETIGLRFDLADDRERDDLLRWIYSIGLDARRTPLSFPQITRRLLARCLG